MGGIVGSVSRQLRIVPHTALGTILTEPLLNNVGARLRQAAVEVANTPLKTANIIVTGSTAMPTVVMECSNDQAAWVQVATITGEGALVNNEAWAYMRLRCTGYTDGEITGGFFGTA